MCGIDVHMDPNIGKRLNALGITLTSLTGEEDIDDIADLNSVNMADLSDEDEPDTMSPTIYMVSHQLLLSFYFHSSFILSLKNDKLPLYSFQIWTLIHKTQDFKLIAYIHAKSAF